MGCSIVPPGLQRFLPWFMPRTEVLGISIVPPGQKDRPTLEALPLRGRNFLISLSQVRYETLGWGDNPFGVKKT